MKSEIVIISGRQGSGKTTLTKALIEKLSTLENTRVSELMFAKPIKDMHDFCIKYLNDRGIYRDIVKDGVLLQLLGTEWGRNSVSDNIWVDLTKADIEKFDKDVRSDIKNIWIISDCRFKNEFHAFPEAIKVRLECDRDIRKQRCEAWRDKENHLSETDLDYYSEAGMFDYLFYTSGGHWTPDQMAEQIFDEIVFRRENAKFCKPKV